LKEILDDSRFVLVGIGILSDLKELREEYYLHSSGVKSFVDLGTVAKTYGKKELGMKALSQYYGYDAEKPKSVQISNWESVPLSDAQIKYAAEDAALAVWIAERMYAEYNDYKNRENKNGKRSRTSAEDDKDVDGFLKWMLAFKNAGNTRSLNKHKLPRNALKSLISSETERVDKYAKERFSQARDLIKKVSSDIKHPTSALMEVYQRLCREEKTLQEEVGEIVCNSSLETFLPRRRRRRILLIRKEKKKDTNKNNIINNKKVIISFVK
jgi:hypothetical protein